MWVHAILVGASFACAFARGALAQTQQLASPRSGADLYRAACMTCHGPDGRGESKNLVGFDTPLPDFTNCKFATPEPDADWEATIHLGGAARAFDRNMPAFGDALSDDEIERVIGYLREFCTDRKWPRGDLNLPRPLVTEKAFPENETVFTTTATAGAARSISTEFAYEHRVGARSQFEVVAPVNLQRSADGSWQKGLGDLAVAMKHVLFDSRARGSIFSAGGELRLPTGKEQLGLGGGTGVLEPFAAFSQALPGNGFLHAHAGLEFPTDQKVANNEAFWRLVVGKTFLQGRWGRAWSPMVEVLAARELGQAEPTKWDLVPEIQVTLSRRQHVMVNMGARLPVNERDGRHPAVVSYFLWDWFDGGLFEGWR